MQHTFFLLTAAAVFSPSMALKTGVVSEFIPKHFLPDAIADVLPGNAPRVSNRRWYHPIIKRARQRAGVYAPTPSPTRRAECASGECHREQCMPQCRYSCNQPTCEETCKPECLQPECQTRCPTLNGMDLAKFGCKVTCKQPQCEVHCPESGCGGKECAKCNTVCHKPVCRLNCPATFGDPNACVDVCKKPKCMFNCAQPTKCPKPECKMVCEPPNGCMKIADGLPPLHPGESVVTNIEPDAATAGLISTHTRIQKVSEDTIENASVVQTMTVEVVTAVPVPGSSEMRFVHTNVSLPVEG